MLSEYLIDYNSLDIKETIASGLWMCIVMQVHEYDTNR